LQFAETALRAKNRPSVYDRSPPFCDVRVGRRLLESELSTIPDVGTRPLQALCDVSRL
jgi:hypothetical protein